MGLLETIVVIILICWLFGVFGAPALWPGYHMGGLVHVLLLVAAVILIVRLVQGRRVL